jgi:hypothetical protein
MRTIVIVSLAVREEGKAGRCRIWELLSGVEAGQKEGKSGGESDSASGWQIRNSGASGSI